MIRLKGITKRYEENVVFNNFNLDIEEGKVLAVLGESGVGKSTLLSIVASLTDYEGETEGVESVSYIFQEDRLIPSLTVKENLELICKGANAEKWIDKVGLSDYKDRYIKELSGGMKRRVSIVRGFMYKSDILLMDEPFNSLDIRLKFSLMDMAKKIQRDEKKTVIFITHNVEEAVNFSDRIIVLEKGGKIGLDIKNTDKNTEKEIVDYFLTGK